eukprot:GEZU01018910.1.p2 GENE.GEZU01018910.1~~GEZU01018910.1.p2  ORF type:complete len:266 (-),score=54.97 GEZU01018910.1:705-1502(-)
MAHRLTFLLLIFVFGIVVSGCSRFFAIAHASKPNNNNEVHFYGLLTSSVAIIVDEVDDAEINYKIVPQRSGYGDNNYGAIIASSSSSAEKRDQELIRVAKMDNDRVVVFYGEGVRNADDIVDDGSLDQVIIGVVQESAGTTSTTTTKNTISKQSAEAKEDKYTTTTTTTTSKPASASSAGDEKKAPADEKIEPMRTICSSKKKKNRFCSTYRNGEEPIRIVVTVPAHTKLVLRGVDALCTYMHTSPKFNPQISTCTCTCTHTSHT